MPALILQIISFIGLAVKAAPQVKQVYDDAKNLVENLFKGGLITKEQQDLYMTWADAHQSAVLAGEVPPEFNVDPDPA